MVIVKRKFMIRRGETEQFPIPSEQGADRNPGIVRLLIIHRQSMHVYGGKTQIHLPQEHPRNLPLQPVRVTVFPFGIVTECGMMPHHGKHDCRSGIARQIHPAARKRRYGTVPPADLRHLRPAVRTRQRLPLFPGQPLAILSRCDQIVQRQRKRIVQIFQMIQINSRLVRIKRIAVPQIRSCQTVQDDPPRLHPVPHIEQVADKQLPAPSLRIPVKRTGDFANGVVKIAE